MFELIFVLGIIAIAYANGMLIWSAVFPKRRIWPPKQFSSAVIWRVWIMTSIVFLSGFIIGILDWGSLNLPNWLRYGVGGILLISGNLFVGRGILKIGVDATSGAATGLKTDGIYQWSRHPQYVADMGIAIGWFLVTSSIWVSVISIFVVIALVVAPFAEEPWLEEVYGDAYRTYKSNVRRFL